MSLQNKQRVIYTTPIKVKKLCLRCSVNLPWGSITQGNFFCSLQRNRWWQHGEENSRVHVTCYNLFCNIAKSRNLVYFSFNSQKNFSFNTCCEEAMLCRNFICNMSRNKVAENIAFVTAPLQVPCHERGVNCSSWCKIGKMNVYSFVAQWNRFELFVDRDVSTAILLVFIRWWGRLFMVAFCTCSMLVCCYWCNFIPHYYSDY